MEQQVKLGSQSALFCNDVLYPHAPMRNQPVFVLLRLRELLAAWLFVWLRDQHPIQSKAEEAQILQ